MALLHYFISGASRPGELAGIQAADQLPGITVNELDTAGTVICDIANATRVIKDCHLFVDSGAFAEMVFGDQGPRIKKLITDEEWSRRLDVYDRLVRIWHRTSDEGDIYTKSEALLYLVAPDMVGNQSVTLQRLNCYAKRLIRMAKHPRVKIIVPLQNGEMSLADFDRQVRQVFAKQGTPGFHYIRGIPSKKRATTTADIAALVQALQDDQVPDLQLHLLGLGPDSPRFQEVSELLGSIPFSCDSVRMRALVGKTNGKGGGPRPLTAAYDKWKKQMPGRDARTHKFNAYWEIFKNEPRIFHNPARRENDFNYRWCYYWKANCSKQPI